MCRSRIYKSGHRGNVHGDDRNYRHKGIGVRKSGRIEAELLGCTVGVNAASRLYGVLKAANYFFDSDAAEVAAGACAGVAVAALALALALLEVDFGQSLAIWPDWPQNIHKLFLMCR